MKKVLHKAEERGQADHGWLKTHYSFSFADWHDSTRMGFGALRVLNDDRIAPSSGFPMHGHRDMEIITIVTEGTSTHIDSLGNTKEVAAGEVQVMSAGTGVVHSENNASADSPLALFQLWIKPKELGIAPRYAQKSFPPVLEGQLGLTELISPDAAEGSLAINQDAWIYSVSLEAGQALHSPVLSPGHGLYIFAIEGVLTAAGEEVGSRDAIGISGAQEVELRSASGATALLIEVPME